MTTVEQPPVDTAWRPGVPAVALLAGLVLGTVVMYAVGQLLPYFHNGYDDLPHSQWATGTADPKDVWPSTTPVVGPLVGLAGWLSLLAVPLVSFAGGLGAVAVGLNVAHRGRWRLATACALTVGTCVALAAFHVSPLGQALTSWRMD